MKKILLQITVMIFLTSVLLTLCGQSQFLKEPFHKPDQHFPIKPEHGKDCWNSALTKPQA